MIYRVNLLGLVLMFFVGDLPADNVVFNAGGFETGNVGEAPAGWQAFPRTSKPSLTLVKSGTNGSHRSLRGERSESGGLTALAREFEVPQRRVLIEFSFAYSNSNGRSLNVWTHEPNSKDASQLNLCIQGGALLQFDGRTRTWEVITRKVEPTVDPAKPVWHRLRALVDSKMTGIDYWISKPNSCDFPDTPITRQAYRTNLAVGAIAFVSGKRIAADAWYLIDDLKVTGGQDLPSPHKVEPLPEELVLWTGPEIPRDLEKIPLVTGMRHQSIHRATADGYRFLHGAAIIHHKGTLYANWANSPTNENGPHETLQGRRSTDGGRTWSDVEVIAPGFKGGERHSHGMLFVHKNELWTICARWGEGTTGSRFLDLRGEAFVLNEQLGKWQSRGIVMENCWPYDQPMRMANGNFITGGQDKDGLPVVAISRGDDMTKWDSVLIPYDPQLKPIYAETSVWGDGERVVAVIRGGLDRAWVATSEDYGRTWSKARPSKMPMPRAKAYLGKLSTGQRYMLSNLKNRDTLIVSVSKPGAKTLSKMWRIRHGKSEAPRFPGKGKFKQWSYPYGYEHDGKLYVV
ncbi:MAG: exo-alpha-sialidase, partial [Pirellulales bacterium]|nr:exo-alpha-sialidase [Pirellulales bacterium]